MGSNHRHADLQSAALPTELSRAFPKWLPTGLVPTAMRRNRWRGTIGTAFIQDLILVGNRRSAIMKNIRQTIAMRSFEAPHSYMGENKSETLMELSLAGRTETASARLFHFADLGDDGLGLFFHESELTNPVALSDP